MPVINIDTLTASRKLKSAGFSGEQVDAIIHIVQQGHDSVATKQDIEMLRMEFNSKLRLIYWMLGFNLAVTTAILLKLLFPA